MARHLQLRLSLRGLLRFILWCALLQHANEMAPGSRHRRFPTQYDVFGCDLAAVDLFAGIIVGTERGAFERYA